MQTNYNGDETKAYSFDYDGSCKPGGVADRGNITFSVGIFQWVPKASGKGLKRSRVIKRIKGLKSNPQWVYERAKCLCEHMQRDWDKR